MYLCRTRTYFLIHLSLSAITISPHTNALQTQSKSPSCLLINNKCGAGDSQFYVSAATPHSEKQGNKRLAFLNIDGTTRVTMSTLMTGKM
jgi:hypothetical protein